MKKNTRIRALHRMKILKGQLEGLERQIEDDEYCMDILTQSLAIQKSLASLSKLMVSHHLETHLVDMISCGDDKLRKKAVAEMEQLYEVTNVRGRW